MMNNIDEEEPMGIDISGKKKRKPRKPMDAEQLRKKEILERRNQ